MRFQKEVRQITFVDLSPSEVMTMTDAQKRLGLSPSAVGGLVLRGTLTKLVDVDEPNPTRANRVLVREVESVLKARRGSVDGRLAKVRKGGR